MKKLLSTILLLATLAVNAQTPPLPSIPPAPQQQVVMVQNYDNAKVGAVLGASIGALIGGNNHRTLAGAALGGAVGWIVGHAADQPKQVIITGSFGTVPTGDYATCPYVVYGPYNSYGNPAYVDEWVWSYGHWQYRRWGWREFGRHSRGRRVIVGGYRR